MLHDPTMHRTVYPGIAFFWKTQLSDERMAEIAEWLHGLPENERKMVDDLLWDKREETAWDCADDAAYRDELDSGV